VPAVEPGFQPGGAITRKHKPLEISNGSLAGLAIPGGRMPPSTSGILPDATFQITARTD
jgi:hypothetical protein